MSRVQGGGMIYGSLFTGICGFDLALDRAGMSCKWQCEIDPSCLALEERHYPGIKRYEDVRQITRDNAETVDLICGGFPCQDLSIAGKRAGLAGERSGLWFEFARVIDELEPSWVVIENVPGLLSSWSGDEPESDETEWEENSDFHIVIKWLAERGYGVAWRVLDAQYFGVAQRRRRVFIVGHLGDGRAAEVLFEREGCAGDTPPSREKGERVAGTITRRFAGASNQWPPMNEADNLIAHALSASPMATGRLDPSGEDFVIAGTLDRKSCGANRGSQANEHEFIVPITFDWQSGGDVRLNVSDKPMLQKSQTPAIAYTIQQNDNGNHKRADRPNGGMYVKETDAALTVGSADMTVVAWQNRQQSGEIRVQGDTLPTVSKQWGTGGNNVPFVGVRRLTPTECERLQGFPDGWTAGQSDSTRYRQLGNAVAVPVVEWIARRIAAL